MEIIEELFELIMDRRNNPKSNSYVSKLMVEGEDRILEKIREESDEVIEASRKNSSDEIVHEVSDLLFHLLVLLGFKNISPDLIEKELLRRRK